MSLLTNLEDVPPLSSAPDSHKTSLQDFSSYELHSVEALVRHFHADAGVPVCDTWLITTTSRNFALWTGLTYYNAAKSFFVSNDTPKGHMVQVRQGILYTKPKLQRINFKLTEVTSLPINTTPSHEMHIKIEHIRKTYNDDTGRFPVRSQSGNQYIMIVYHCGSNAITVTLFKYFSKNTDYFHIDPSYNVSSNATCWDTSKY